MEEGTVALRTRKDGDQGKVNLADFESRLLTEIKDKIQQHKVNFVAADLLKIFLCTFICSQFL